ncbi:MAG: DinB family protein [Anaerolineae bacterium]
MTAEIRDNCKQLLTHSREQLNRLLARLTEEQWQTPVFTEDNTWTVADIVAHLIETERGMSIQAHKARKGQETIPQGFDLDRYNAGMKKRMGTLSPAELLQGLAQVRAKTLAVIDTLTGEDWGKMGRHPSRGMITVEQYYHTIAAHERIHSEDIKNTLGLP